MLKTNGFFRKIVILINSLFETAGNEKIGAQILFALHLWNKSFSRRPYATNKFSSKKIHCIWENGNFTKSTFSWKKPIFLKAKNDEKGHINSELPFKTYCISFDKTFHLIKTPWSMKIDIYKSNIGLSWVNGHCHIQRNLGISVSAGGCRGCCVQGRAPVRFKGAKAP